MRGILRGCGELIGAGFMIVFIAALVVAGAILACALGVGLLVVAGDLIAIAVQAAFGVDLRGAK